MPEPDLGTSLCFMLLLLGLLWMVGLPLRYFALLVLGVGAVVTVLAVTESYRLQRLTTFLHPIDPQGAGYHTLQGLYALSSGGVFGVGLGQGTSKYGWVPNANTDYVFAVVGEELGLLGSVAVLLLFGLFACAGVRIALRSNDPFVRLVAGGAAIWIAGQALINIGYVTALLPVTGIPLPFISTGGTSLILTCVVLGMLVSFARHEPAAVAEAQRATASGTRGRGIAMGPAAHAEGLCPAEARGTRPQSRAAGAHQASRADRITAQRRPGAASAPGSGRIDGGSRSAIVADGRWRPAGWGARTTTPIRTPVAGDRQRRAAPFRSPGSTMIATGTVAS